MRLYAIQTRAIETNESVVCAVIESIKGKNLQLEDNDVLAITSKAVSFSQGRLARLNDVEPSKEARKLAQKHSLRPELAELILREADEIYGGVEKAILTLKDNALTANAGIDNKNAPGGYVVLWPVAVKQWAREAKEEIRRKTGKQVAVLIVDSSLVPLRMGTVGLALAVAGFRPVRDTRGKKDLYGKPLIITRHAVADDLASAAHLLMGEASEETPAVLIKEAPVDFDEGAYDSVDMMMPFRECMFMGTFLLNK